MSYLPSSRLYSRDPDPAPKAKAKPAPAKVTVAAPPPPESVAAASLPPPAPMPAPAPVPVMAPVPPPPMRAPVPPPVMPGPKEWLVAPTPILNMAAPTPKAPEETVTKPAVSPKAPGRTRDMFNRAQKVVLRQIDRAKNRQPDPAEPDLLWFAVMVTGSLCMGLMIWGAYSALPRFGMVHRPLRAEVTSPKLKVSNEVPVHWVHETPPPPQVPPIVPPMPVAPVMPIAAPPPPRDPLPEFPAPGPVEPPLAPLPERKEPVIFVNAKLGDTPMIRTWKKLSEASLLTAALTMATSNNLLAQIPDRITVDHSKEITDLTKAVQALSEQVNALKFDEKLNTLKNDIDQKLAKIKLEAPKGDNAEFLLLAQRLEMMEKSIERLARQPIAAPPVAVAPPLTGTGNLDEIKSKLGSIEQAILKLQPTEKRIALAPPSPEPAVKTGGSNVIFVNLYNQDLWLWVNQKQHRAPAGTTLTLDSIPAGPATIEVRSPDGIFHKSNPTLVANETFTLTAR